MTANFLTLPNLPIYLSDGVTQASTGVVVLGQEYVLIFSQSLNSGGGGFFIENAAVPASVVAAGGSVSGLVITNNVATPTLKLDVSINEVTLNNAAGQSLRFAPGGVAFGGPIDLSVNGINGLDTGAINTATSYFLWAISNGGLLRGLVSTSATLAGLTFPSGYTFAKLLGAWRTLPASAILWFGTQRGSTFQYQMGTTPQNVLPTAIIAASSGTWASQSLANTVPQSTVIKGANLFTMGASTSVNSGGQFAGVAPNGNYATSITATNPPPILHDLPFTAGAGLTTSGPKTVRGFLPTTGPVFWISNAAAQIGLYVDGWEVNL
jgi:hypothetical protein